MNFRIYNFRFVFQELYTWNKGNQLAYPIKYQGFTNATIKEDMRGTEIGI